MADRGAALIRTWRPWEKSTGPRSVEGKARTARNGFKGGYRAMLRSLARELNAVLREQREMLQRCPGSTERVPAAWSAGAATRSPW